MKTRLRIGLSFAFVGLLLGAVFLILHKKDPDLSGDEAPFSSIALPLKSVNGDMYMDGGSICVMVVDGKGKKFDFAFPYDYHSKAGTHYGEAFHGAQHAGHLGAIRLHNPERAKEIVLALMDRYAEPDDRFVAGLNDTLAERHIPFKAIIATGRKVIK